MSTRRFTFQEGSSNKFWEIELDECEFNVRYGRIGTDGQTQSKSFASASEAKKQYEKLVAEKLKKGYVEESSTIGGASKTAVESKPKKGTTSNAETKPVAKAVKGSSKPKEASKPKAGQIALDVLANAVEKTDATGIAAMFDGVSEEERARVRSALLEIHGLFGRDKQAIKPNAIKKYTPAECKNKCKTFFEFFVETAVLGPRDDVVYAVSKATAYWPKEACKLLRDRPAEWLHKKLRDHVRSFGDSHEWLIFVREGVFAPVLDDVAIQALLDFFYQDANASEIKNLYKTYPWISDLVYRIYGFKNWTINSSNSMERLSCLLAFIDFLANQKVLDRNKLVSAVLNGMHQVPVVKHVGACVQILEHIEPTVEELIANQGELCAALSLGHPTGHDYLLKQFELCCSNKKLDASTACGAIATVLLQATSAIAKHAFAALVAFGQVPSNQPAVASALAQALLHTKRDISELALKTLRSLFSNQDKVAIQSVNGILPHCSQVVKKQVKDWLSGPIENPVQATTDRTSKAKASQTTKTESKGGRTPLNVGEPLKRSPETIKEFRDALPSFSASLKVESYLFMCTYYAGQSIENRDLFDRLVTTHFGIPYTKSATEILDEMKKNGLGKESKSGGAWWEGWSNTFTAAVALGNDKYAKELADWFNFERRETSYDFQKPSAGICYLTVLLANHFRKKKLEPKRAMQAALARDKNAKGWFDVYQALEASNELDFLKGFSKTAQKHIRQYESDIKAEKEYRATPISEIGTLLWHVGKRQGINVNQLDKDAMAIIITSESLGASGKSDSKDRLRLPLPKDRLTQSLNAIVKLLKDCDIPFAVTRPYTKDHDNEFKVYRWQLVADISSESFQKLYVAHDPSHFVLNRQVLDLKRKYETPLLIDVRNGVAIDHVQLSKPALSEVLSMVATSVQNGVSIPTARIEHVVALACPVVDEYRKKLAASHGKLANRLHACGNCAEYSQRVIELSEEKGFNWKTAQQLAARIPSAKATLTAIQRGEKVPPRFNSLYRLEYD